VTFVETKCRDIRDGFLFGHRVIKVPGRPNGERGLFDLAAATFPGVGVRTICTNHSEMSRLFGMSTYSLSLFLSVHLRGQEPVFDL